MKIQQSRSFGLDLLRAIAIGLVVLSHCTYLLFPSIENPIVTFIRVFGAVGVDLFFVLSGFLIGGILLKNIELGKNSFSDLLRFWNRRWLRTLPNYFLVLLLNIVLIKLIGEKGSLDFGQYFVFLQNFSVPHPDFFTEAWSLSIEEFAYLIVPVLLYFAIFLFKKKDQKKSFLYVTLGMIACLTIFKVLYYLNVSIDSYKQWSSTFRKVVIYRIDSIYMGFLLVYFIRKYTRFIECNRGLFAYSGIILIIVLHLSMYIFQMLPQTHLGFFVFVYLQVLIIGLGMLFPYFLKLKYHGRWSSGVLFISTRSYAIYLINYSLVLLSIERCFNVAKMTVISRLGLVLLYLLITIVISELLFRYFERPILKYRNRRFPN